MPRLGLVLFVVVVCPVAALRAQTDSLSLFPTADTALLEGQPDFNLGAQDDFPAGTLGPTVGAPRSRALLYFDLASALPPGSRITHAVLGITVTRTPDGGGVASRFGLHRMLRPWNEGTKRGGPPGGARAQDGEPTWLARQAPDQLWDAPGGAAGTDFVEAASSTERLADRGTYEFEFGSNQIAELQTWLDDPTSNHGWLLKSQQEDEPLTARRIGSREHSNADVRPFLSISFSVAPVIPRPLITGIELVDGRARVTFEAEAGVTYTLELTSTSTRPEWLPSGPTVTAPSTGALSMTDTTQPALDQRYYRLAATLAAAADVRPGGS